jgi:signal transduction histidine kinase
MPDRYPAGNGPDFKKLFEAAPGLFLVLTPDLIIVAASDAYLKATKTRREEILGHGLFEIFPDNPDDPHANGVSNLKASLDRVLLTKEPDAMAVQKYDIQLPDRGGFEVRYWSPLNSPVFGPENKITHIIHRVEDITDFMDLKNKREELESQTEKMAVEIFLRAKQLQEANQKLIEAERVKGEFFANVSHELRTPLSLIFAPVESLISGKPGRITSQQRELLEMIRNNSIRLLQLVNGLLDFSKLEAGKMKVEREPFELNKLISTVANDFNMPMRERNIKLNVELDRSDPVVMMDRYLFERILFNLLSNAAKFTGNGGNVWVRARTEGDRPRLEVQDTGIGIDEKDFPGLFKKFRQIEGSSTRRFQGTGLGLAMVKEFSELLGGSVNVESIPGKGSTFAVLCDAPVVEKEGYKNEGGMEKESTPAGMAHDHRMSPTIIAKEDNKALPKILVCEDNEDLLLYINLLVKEFANVRLARNGREGLRLVESWHPDLVLTDVMMPEMDGLTLCRTIKSNPETSNTCVVLLTALAHRQAMLQGWEVKADEYLFKPFHPEELVTRLKSLLSAIEARARSEQAIRTLNTVLTKKTLNLEESLTHERALNEMKSRFVSMASHEFRTPLSTILSSASLVQSLIALGDTTKVLKHVDRIRKSVGHLTGILNDFLSLDKLEQGKIEVELEEFNLQDLLSDVIVELRDMRKANQEIRLAFSGENRVTIDERIVRNIVINLLTNAIKYSEKEIDLSVVVTDREVHIKVTDKGIGIPEEDQRNLFEKFYRGKNVLNIPGTGLGLIIVKRYLEMLNGTIELCSVEGAGTTVDVRFPLNNPPPPSPPSD